jgi:uncharacterized protein YwqG
VRRSDWSYSRIDEMTDADEFIAQQRERIRRFLADNGLRQVAGILAGLARPSIRLALQRIEQQDVGVGNSRVGGLPDLPPGVGWPTWNSVPQAFIAQINLAEAAPFDVDHLLPSDGVLSFFYGFNVDVVDDDPAGVFPTAAGSWRVLYFADLARLRPRPAPAGLPGDSLFGACAATFSSSISMPSREEPAVAMLGLSERERDMYSELLNQPDLIPILGPPTLGAYTPSSHRLLGYADWIQWPDQIECEVSIRQVTGGAALNQAEIVALRTDWQRLDRWTLLFQIDSEWELNGMLWGDAGRLYYMLPRDALARHEFDKTWLLAQWY